MISINKSDFFKLIEFALEEYSGRNTLNRVLTVDDKLTQRFGSIFAEVSIIVADKQHLYVRRYEVKDTKGNTIVSFILGHVAMLFSVSTRKFREELLSIYSIKGVITLKQRMFKHITTPMAVIVLNKDKGSTWFTSVEDINIFIDILLGNIPDEQKIYHSDSISVESMMPEYYNGDDQIIEDSMNEKETTELGKIAVIINGKCAKKEDFVEIGIPYLRARDIQDGKIKLPKICIDPNKASIFSKQLLQEGDILLTKYFKQNKLIRITSADTPAIASNSFFIIRPYGVSEGYLYRYLNSKTGSNIFNKQLNRIQKGETIPFVTLRDLAHIRVPIYDKQTMQDIEGIDSLGTFETINMTKRLVENNKRGFDLEKEVYEKLIKAGWSQEMLLNENERESWISIDKNRKWRPDFVYELPDKRRVYIEVKTDLTHVKPEWVLAIQKLLYGNNNCFFILTTGMYYEVHVTGIDSSLKLLQTPTITEILRWEKEMC